MILIFFSLVWLRTEKHFWLPPIKQRQKSKSVCKNAISVVRAICLFEYYLRSILLNNSWFQFVSIKLTFKYKRCICLRLIIFNNQHLLSPLLLVFCLKIFKRKIKNLCFVYKEIKKQWMGHAQKQFATFMWKHFFRIYWGKHSLENFE